MGHNPSPSVERQTKNTGFVELGFIADETEQHRERRESLELIVFVDHKIIDDDFTERDSGTAVEFDGQVEIEKNLADALAVDGKFHRRRLCHTNPARYTVRTRSIDCVVWVLVSNANNPRP